MKKRAAKRPVVVLTIGHSTHPLDDFLHILLANGVTRLIDVRTIPRSRHNPQFNAETLPRDLANVGIAYQHMAGLGGLRHARPDSPNGAWRNDSFRGFADFMQTPEFAKNIQELIDLAKSDRVALMCAEAVPWRCHRSLIADALTVRGFEVEHIMSASSRQKHTLRPWAVVKGKRITYPPETGSQPASSSQTRSSPRSALSKGELTMPKTFHVGDHVEWNSEAGRVRGTIKKKITSAIKFKGYTVRASKEEPQYLIESDKTDHQAMHKGSALKRIRKSKS